MTSQNILAEFLQLLDKVEDFLETGFRQVPKQYSESRESLLAEVTLEVSQCRRCALCKERKQSVPGEGSHHPLVMIIGEGPGAEEDRTGKPFVGPAGRYLDKWLSAVRLGDSETFLERNANIFIANVVKCRPPHNRDPLPEEISACLPYLERQIDILKPRAVLTVGRIAALTLTQCGGSLGALRGRVYTYRGIPLIPTYHPSAVLRENSLKGKEAVFRGLVWEDLKHLMALLNNDSIR